MSYSLKEMDKEVQRLEKYLDSIYEQLYTYKKKYPFTLNGKLITKKSVTDDENILDLMKNKRKIAGHPISRLKNLFTS